VCSCLLLGVSGSAEDLAETGTSSMQACIVIETEERIAGAAKVERSKIDEKFLNRGIVVLMQ
jgi:hypothetical protein